jgi:hypothetical protein
MRNSDDGKDTKAIVEYFLNTSRREIRLLMRRTDPSLFYNFTVK